MIKPPAITKHQMQKIDELMEKEFGIEVKQMMEVAGLSIALFVKKIFKTKRNNKVACLAGKGNNGGDCITAARHLKNFGANPVVIIPFKKGFKGITRKQLQTARKMNVPVFSLNKSRTAVEQAIKNSDIILDGLLGFNIKGNPKNEFQELINLVNDYGEKVVSIDMPSGLHANGRIGEPCIKADYTIAISLPKKGLYEKKTKKVVGKVYLSYLGLPEELLKKMKIKMKNPFKEMEIIRIR